MSNGDGIDGRSPGIIALVVSVCVILSWLVVWDLSGDKHDKAISAKKNTYESQREIDREIAACSGADDCIERAVTEFHKQATEKYDLDAQQSMAKYALWLTVFTSAQVILSGLGIYYIAGTLQKTVEQLELSQKTVVIENRPWIRIEPREASDMWFDVSGGRMNVAVMYNNIGNSPALRLAFSSGEIDFAASDFDQIVERFKEKLKRDFLASERRGQTVFPNESSRATGMVKVKPKTITDSIIDPSRPRVKLFSASFIFSVVYQSAIDDTVFQTTVVMSMIEDHPDGMMRSIPIDDLPIPNPIPVQQIFLMLYPGTYTAT